MVKLPISAIVTVVLRSIKNVNFVYKSEKLISMRHTHMMMTLDIYAQVAQYTTRIQRLSAKIRFAPFKHLSRIVF
jgi:hypothetical protein